MCFHGSIKQFFQLKLFTEVFLIISKDTSYLCKDLFRNKVTVITELDGPILRKCRFKNVLP